MTKELRYKNLSHYLNNYNLCMERTVELESWLDHMQI